MAGRRTSLILLLLIAAAQAGPAGARSIFDEARAREAGGTAPAAPAAADEFPLADLVLGKVRSGSDALGALPADARITVEPMPGAPEWAASLEGFRYDPSSGRFSAVARDGAGQGRAVSGRVAVEVPVAVPVRRIEAGEVVSAADLETVNLPLSALGAGMQADGALIAGSEARRPLMAGRPVQAGSLVAPRMVRKGAAVLITISEGGLSLSAPGKAMADGAAGEILRIINTHSGKVIHAEVIGEGKVRAISGPVE